MKLTMYTLNDAVNTLLRLADEQCINTLSGNNVFIKRYDIEAPFKDKEDVVRYILECIVKHDVYSIEQINEDINNYTRRGLNIKWIDLTLYYSTPSESYFVVNLIQSETQVETQYHVGIICTMNNLENKPYNLNDYVDEMIKRWDIKQI